MNKNSIKLALLLLLGIGFQTQAMNELEELIKKEKTPEAQLETIISYGLINKTVEKIISGNHNNQKNLLKELFDHNVLSDAVLKNCSPFLRPSSDTDVTEFFINCGANVNAATVVLDSLCSLLFQAACHWSNCRICNDNRTMKLIEEYIKFLLGHNAILDNGEYRSNAYIRFKHDNELKVLCTLVDEVDNNHSEKAIERIIEQEIDKNYSEKELIKNIIKTDEKWIVQRFLMKMNSSIELRNFSEKLKKTIEKKFHLSLGERGFQESLIENNATPAIIYQLMIKGIVPITKERIMAQPSKKRRNDLAKHVFFSQNKMIKFNSNFDAKLIYN